MFLLNFSFLFYHPVLSACICIIWFLHKYFTSTWSPYPLVFTPVGLHFFKSMHSVKYFGFWEYLWIISAFRKFLDSIFYCIVFLFDILNREQSPHSFEHCFLSHITFLPFLKIGICTSFIYFWQISQALGN